MNLDTFFEKKRQEFAAKRGKELYSLEQDVRAFLKSALLLRSPLPGIDHNERTVVSLAPSIDCYATVELPVITMPLPRTPSNTLK